MTPHRSLRGVGHTDFSTIKIGRWLADKHPEHVDAGSWTRELAAGSAARVDRMVVGEYSHAPNGDYMRRRSGGQMPRAPRRT